MSGIRKAPEDKAKAKARLEGVSPEEEQCGLEREGSHVGALRLTERTEQPRTN